MQFAGNLSGWRLQRRQGHKQILLLEWPRVASKHRAKPANDTLRFRYSLVVERLQVGVLLERISVLLGQQSVRITDQHNSPWALATGTTRAGFGARLLSLRGAAGGVTRAPPGPCHVRT